MKKYILGIITVILAIPILESLSDVIQVLIEVPKGIFSKKVLLLNNEIQKLQTNSEPINTTCIGFQAPSELDYDSFDED